MVVHNFLLVIVSLVALFNDGWFDLDFLYASY